MDKLSGFLQHNSYNINVGMHRICRFVVFLTSPFSAACRYTVLTKASESSHHTGRSIVGSGGKSAPPGPFREFIERTQNLGRAPGADAGAVSELGDDPGFGERVDITACIASRYAQFALE